MPKRPAPPAAVHQPPDLSHVWTFYRVRWDFLTSVCASTPADPDVIDAWLRAREPRVKPAGARSIEELNEEVLASIERGEGEPEQSYNMLVFQRHQGAIVQRAATVRAHLKDCARVLSAQFIGRIQGERSFATRVINGVYLDERQYWLPICDDDDQPITKADDSRDRAIHVRGPRGEPLSALKRYEYIEPPSTLTFILKVLGKSISPSDLDHLFTYGGTHGYGGERSDGEGRYTYTFERLDAAPRVDPAFAATRAANRRSDRAQV